MCTQSLDAMPQHRRPARGLGKCAEGRYGLYSTSAPCHHQSHSGNSAHADPMRRPRQACRDCDKQQGTAKGPSSTSGLSCLRNKKEGIESVLEVRSDLGSLFLERTLLCIQGRHVRSVFGMMWICGWGGRIERQEGRFHPVSRHEYMIDPCRRQLTSNPPSNQYS